MSIIIDKEDIEDFEYLSNVCSITPFEMEISARLCEKYLDRDDCKQCKGCGNQMRYAVRRVVNFYKKNKET